MSLVLCDIQRDKAALVKFCETWASESSWNLEDLAKLLPQPHYFGYFFSHNDEHVGFAFCSQPEDTLDLLYIYILPKFRGQGIGKTFLNHLITQWKQAHSTQKIFLEVREDNQTAISLYKSCHFKAHGRRKNYYADGCDALVFQLDFTN